MARWRLLRIYNDNTDGDGNTVTGWLDSFDNVGQRLGAASC
jgi:hypothetical protein